MGMWSYLSYCILVNIMSLESRNEKALKIWTPQQSEFRQSSAHPDLTAGLMNTDSLLCGFSDQKSSFCCSIVSWLGPVVEKHQLGGCWDAGCCSFQWAGEVVLCWWHCTSKTCIAAFGFREESGQVLFCGVEQQMLTPHNPFSPCHSLLPATQLSPLYFKQLKSSSDLVRQSFALL